MGEGLAGERGGVVVGPFVGTGRRAGAAGRLPAGRRAADRPIEKMCPLVSGEQALDRVMELAVAAAGARQKRRPLFHPELGGGGEDLVDSGEASPIHPPNLPSRPSGAGLPRCLKLAVRRFSPSP